MHQNTSSGLWENSGKKAPGTGLSSQRTGSLTEPVCGDHGTLESVKTLPLPEQTDQAALRLHLFLLLVMVTADMVLSHDHSFHTLQCCRSRVSGAADMQLGEPVISNREPASQPRVLSSDGYFRAQR